MCSEYIGITQAAQICNCAPSTIYNRISRGQFVPTIERNAQGVYRFLRHEVEEFARTYIKHPRRSSAPCPPHLITVAEMCEVLKCAKSSIKRLVQTGRLPPPVEGGGVRGSRMLFDRAAFNALAATYRKGERAGGRELMSLRAVATALHRSANLVRRWVASGEFPRPVRRQGNRVWFDRAEAEAAIARILAEADDLISTREAARIMGCSRQRIHQRLACGSFPEPVKRVGRTAFFRRAEVEEYARLHPKGERLTRAERVGSSGLIGLGEAASILGIDRGSLYHLVRTGRFVQPVRREPWGYAYDPAEVARFKEENRCYLQGRRRLRCIPMKTGVVASDDTVTLVEAARIVGCEPSELYRRLYRGQFVQPVQRRKHGRYLFNRAAVLAYRERQQTSTLCSAD